MQDYNILSVFSHSCKLESYICFLCVIIIFISLILDRQLAFHLKKNLLLQLQVVKKLLVIILVSKQLILLYLMCNDRTITILLHRDISKTIDFGYFLVMREETGYMYSLLRGHIFQVQLKVNSCQLGLQQVRAYPVPSTSLPFGPLWSF